MANILIAVDGFTSTISDLTLTVVYTETGVPSTKVFAEGSGVCLDSHSYTITSITNTDGYTVAGSFVLGFNSSTTKTEVESQGPLRLGDTTDTLTVTLTHPTSGATVSVSLYYTITSAGQTKVLCQ